jgi:hypothetical protein
MTFMFFVHFPRNFGIKFVSRDILKRRMFRTKYLERLSSSEIGLDDKLSIVSEELQSNI